MLMAPVSVFAAERGHGGGHDRGRVAVQRFDRGQQVDRGHIRVNRDFDRGRSAFFGGIVVNPAPEYVAPGYGYYSTPAPGYAVPAPNCNVPPYGY
jgi:hypothetical protein